MLGPLFKFMALVAPDAVACVGKLCPIDAVKKPTHGWTMLKRSRFGRPPPGSRFHQDLIFIAVIANCISRPWIISKTVELPLCRWPRTNRKLAQLFYIKLFVLRLPILNHSVGFQYSLAGYLAYTLVPWQPFSLDILLVSSSCNHT